jgi:hypothetical protein
VTNTKFFEYMFRQSTEVRKLLSKQKELPQNLTVKQQAKFLADNLPGPEATTIWEWCNKFERDQEYLDKVFSRNGHQPSAAVAEIKLEKFSEVQVKKLNWLWANRIPEGFLTIFAGVPGKGKSLATIDVAARVSTGAPFPFGDKTPPGDVLILSAEDDPSMIIRPRLDVAKADVSRVYHVKMVKVTLADGAVGELAFSLERDLEKLEEELAKLPNAKLIIIDPLSAYLGKGTDAFKEAEVRRVLAPLTMMAATKGITIIAIMHLKKGDAAPLMRVINSVGFVATARTVWGFGNDPVSEKPCMVPMKNNLGPLGKAISYIVETSPHHVADGVSRIVWGKEFEITADEALRDMQHTGRVATKLVEITLWLQDALKDGPVSVPSLTAKAKQLEYGWRTVERVKEHMGVKSSKAKTFGGVWFWSLPVEEVPEPDPEAKTASKET